VNAAVFHRRRAERFAQLLDEAEGRIRNHSRSADDPELAPLVDLGQQINGLVESVEPDPIFRSDLRTMLLAAAERDGIGITAVTAPADARPNRRRSAGTLAAPGRRGRLTRKLRTRGAIIVVVAAGTLALSGISTASGDALPGDPLYGVKRSTERAQLALASSDVSRGLLHLEFARTRVAEAAAVRQNPADLVAVLNDMDAETRQGVNLLNTAAVQRRDPAPLDAVNRFVEHQQRRVVALLEGQPAEVRPRVLGSLTLLESVTRRIYALRTALNCGAAEVGNDALGPLPNTCRAAGSSNSPSQIEQDKPVAGQPTSPLPNPSPSAEDDGGLLDDLGRFLDDLLGG
jgi:hypothetical protein